MVCPCFQFERGHNFPFDWSASVSNISTVRKWAEHDYLHAHSLRSIVGRPTLFDISKSQNIKQSVILLRNFPKLCNVGLCKAVINTDR